MVGGGPARAYHSPLPPTSLVPVLYSGLGIRSKLDYAFIATLAMLLLAVAGAVNNERPIAGLVLNTLSTVAGCAGIVAWITFQVGIPPLCQTVPGSCSGPSHLRALHEYLNKVLPVPDEPNLPMV